MCDCIEKVQAKLTDMMAEQNQGCGIEEQVQFRNIAWVQKGNKMEETLTNPASGKYKIKNKVRKWTVSMNPSYCPFCGKHFD